MNVLLVKPPERSRLNFGAFSLAVLAAYVRDLAGISIFDATHHSVDGASSAMLSKNYDLIGITVMSPSSVKSVCALIRSMHRIFKQNGRPLPPIVCGGHGASMYPYPLLAAGADFVVYGQGEQPFRAMLQNMKADVPGTIRKHKKDLVRIPAVDVVSPEQL
ncbi:MAG: cobalamin-dependent protein, partial [Smithellaceae bacterium]